MPSRRCSRTIWPANHLRGRWPRIFYANGNRAGKRKPNLRRRYRKRSRTRKSPLGRNVMSGCLATGG